MYRLTRPSFALALAVCGTLLICSQARPADPADDGKLRIICFGAHPDDAEYKSGGTAALWAKQGHHVKLVSVTNAEIRQLFPFFPEPQQE